MRKSRTLEQRYQDTYRKQQKTLEDFAEYEYEWSGDLILWYSVKKLEIPEDEYRACAYFRNREYKNKLGSLTLLYEMNNRCNNELPEATRENAFDILRFKYKMYAQALKQGGF